MSFKVLMRILKSRWLSFTLVVLLTLIAVGVGTWLTPKRYTANASLVADVKLDPIAGMVLQGAASPSYLITQIDILQSTRVSQRVVAALRLTELPELRAQWLAQTKGQGDFPAWVASILRAGLDVRPSRGSNVINVYFTGSDPNFAAAIANAFVKAYLETTVELKTGPAKEYSKFFDTNAKTLRDNLEAAQAKLSAFQQKSGLVVTDERLDIETQRLNELNAQLVAIQATANDSRSRETQALTQADRMQEVMGNPLVSGMRADLARQEGQLEQIGGRLGDNHPQVRELKLGIADLKEKLNVEIKRATASVGVSNQVAQSRVGQTRFALEEQRTRVLKMKAVRDEAAVLGRDIENAQRAYDGVLSRLNMTNLESQNVQSNVASLEHATAPNLPSSPRVITNALMGGLLALVLGCAMVWVREARDRRLRSDLEFETLLNVPLIGTVPSFNKKRLENLSMPKLARLGYGLGKAG